MQEIQARYLGQEDPLEKKWQHTPIFLPGKSHGQKSLEGYSPQGHKELDTTEHACMNTGLQRCQGPKGTKG